jgi:hypothetical protein
MTVVEGFLNVGIQGLGLRLDFHQGKKKKWNE